VNFEPSFNILWCKECKDIPLEWDWFLDTG
jgi:hypothetical protein